MDEPDRPRQVKWPDGQLRSGFTPAVSKKALTENGQTVRRWAFHQRNDWSVEELARRINPAIRGWINSYGRYQRSALAPALGHINVRLAWWAYRKFKSLKRSRTQAHRWLDRLGQRAPDLFAHWKLVGTLG